MNRLLTLLQTMLSLCWNFFRLKFPGTNVTFGALLFLPMIVIIAVAFFRHMFGVGGFGSIGQTVSSFRGHIPKDKVKIYEINRTPSRGIRGIK